MKYCFWDEEKNKKLKPGRGISFEEVAFCIENGAVKRIIEHPNRGKYAGQSIAFVEIKNYVYLVPFIETDNAFILKTVFPSRKAARLFEKEGHDEKGQTR